MTRVPDVIEDWVRDYISGEGGSEVAEQTIQEVQSRSEIPDQSGVFYVVDEDAVVLRINT